MRQICTLLVLLIALSASAVTIEKIKYGDFDTWVVRNIKESSVIGGNTKTLYEIGPNMTINGDKPYVNAGGSPWATSNVMAKVMGVTKTSNAVYKDKRGNGNCARLTTIMEKCKALGIIDINVLVSGSIFMGRIMEPISSTKNPYSKMDMGVRFNKRPDYLIFDYKVLAPGGNQIYSSGFGSQKIIPGKDSAEVFVLLQQRSEDKDGNIHAKRVGTGRERFSKSTADWVDQHMMPIYYGDITKTPQYKPFMKLIDKDSSYYARNSRGKMVPVIEDGWADADATPTHVILMASSGCGTAYVGTVGMTLWIDNIGFGYE